MSERKVKAIGIHVFRGEELIVFEGLSCDDCVGNSSHGLCAFLPECSEYAGVDCESKELAKPVCFVTKRTNICVWCGCGPDWPEQEFKETKYGRICPSCNAKRGACICPPWVTDERCPACIPSPERDDDLSWKQVGLLVLIGLALIGATCLVAWGGAV